MIKVLSGIIGALNMSSATCAFGGTGHTGGALRFAQGQTAITSKNVADNATLSAMSFASNGLNLGETAWTTASLRALTVTVGDTNVGGVNIGDTVAGGAVAIGSSTQVNLYAPFVRVGGAADLYPATGRIRLPNGNFVIARSTVGADINVIGLDIANRVIIGSTTDSADVFYRATSNHAFNSGSTTVLLLTSSNITAGKSIQFDEALSSATIGMQSKFSASGAGSPLNVTGQQALGSGNVGGVVNIRGGAGITAAYGTVRILSDVSLFVAEFGQISTTQRVVSFCRTTATTATQVPDGDLLVYIGNAAVEPTLNPTSGFELYSSSARPAFFGASTMLQTTVGAAGGASAPPATPTQYIRMKFNGQDLVVPAYAQA
jgi:hypothetical protein